MSTDCQVAQIISTSKASFAKALMDPGLPLQTEAPIMAPNGVDFSFPRDSSKLCS